MGTIDEIVNLEEIHVRRRSSASERAKQMEEINGIITGRNVLITGGAAGLGQAFLHHFLKHGARNVTILDVDRVAGENVERSAEKSYGEKKVHFINADVSNREALLEAFERANHTMNGIDVVVNNAGILDERRWEGEIAVNIVGMLNTALQGIRFMSKQNSYNGGTLVNVSQYTNIKNTAQLPVYASTKHSVIGLSQSLSDPLTYEKTGIRILTLCPGLTETALTMNSPNKLLSRSMKVDFVKHFDQLSIQTPHVVAQGLMTILRFAENSTIWVLEEGQSPYEIYQPDPITLRRQYKNNFTIIPTKTKTIPGRPIREVCDNTRTGLSSCTT